MDNINLFLTHFLTIQALGYGVSNPWIIMVMVLGPTLFFTSQWEEFHSRICKHAIMGLYGVTEIQLTCVLFCFIAGFNRSLYGLTLGDIFGKDTYLMTEWTAYDGSPLGHSLLVSAILVICTSFAFPGYFIQMYLVYKYTDNKPKWKALLGFFPMIEYWGTIYCTFY